MPIPRPPIVVILGHVDHGKTTLLDYLRQTNVASREAGGITQHIRSFQYRSPEGNLITFIDTPGHAAFTHIRSRGSSTADIALLIVSADDGVMPQTKESIELINQAKIPFIVVITKADLPSADPDRVKTQLTENGIIVEDYGGQVPSVIVSAKTGQGITELVEMIALIASFNPPQGDPEAQLEAVVLEGQMDSKKGSLANVIVKNGTLTVGQNLFQTAPIGKARALHDSQGESLAASSLSQPVQILGLTQVPAVGSLISTQVVSNVNQAPSKPTPDSSNSTLMLVLRTDVVGSLEAILASLDPAVYVLTAATGEVSEKDVLEAAPLGARIIAFNVKVPSGVAKLAETEKVTISSYKIIYELLEDLDKLLYPVSREKILGRADVIAEFKINADRVAGCRCTEGVLEKGQTLRIDRSGQVLGQTRFKTLQQGKTVVDRIKVGQEFGAILSPYIDFKVGDTIIAFTNQ